MGALLRVDSWTQEATLARKRRSRRISLDPEDVLRGHTRVGLEELLRLIHRVNPTDRGLSPIQEAERYRTKAALQSLLIREHGSSLVVEASAHDPELLSIRHLSGLADACHARLDQLDDEARLWVRRRLDEVPEEQASPRLEPRHEASQDLLTQGRRALEEYDFDQARTCLEQAVHASGGAEPAAVALLELLVDWLADERGALTLAPRLGHTARQSPAVMGLLAVAAARVGDPSATDYLRTLQGSRAAEATAILARRAVEEGDLEGGRCLLDRLRELDPVHTALMGLQERLDQARSAAREPSERALLALEEHGSSETVQEAAHELLRRWPGSAVAAQVLSRLDRAERAQHLAGLRERARSARGRGAAHAEVSLLVQALELEREDEALRAWLEEARERLREQQRQSRLEEVRELLGSEREQGLLAWLALASVDRAEVSVTDPALALLESFGELRGRRQPEAVQAVLALERASSLPLDSALELVQAHPLLERLPQGRQLRDELLEARHERELARARERLDRAHRALERDEDEGAIELLEPLVPSELAAQRQGLLTRARSALDQRLAEARWRDLTAREEWLLAREHARSRGWAEREARAQEGLHRQFRLQCLPPEAGYADLRDFHWHRAKVAPCVWVDPSGQAVWLVDTPGHRVVARRVRLADGAITELVSLVPPEPMGRTLVSVDPRGRLWLADQVHLLLLDTDPWTILDWVDLRAAAGVSEVCHTVVGPCGRYLWVHTRVPPGWVVLDGDQGLRRSARLPPVGEVAPVPGPDTMAMTRQKGGALGLFPAAGSRQPQERVRTSYTGQVTVASDGASLLFYSGIRANDRSRTGPLAAWIAAGEGEPRIYRLPDSDRTRPTSLATSLDHGCAYLHWQDAEGGATLARLEPSRGGRLSLTHAPAPAELMLIQHPRGRVAVGLVSVPMARRVVALDDPHLELPRHDDPRVVPTFDVPFESLPLVRSLGWSIPGGKLPKLPDRVDDTWLEGSADQLLARALVALTHEQEELAIRLLRAAVDQSPTLPAARAALAWASARRGQHGVALDLVEQTRLHRLPTGHQATFQALRGMALSRLGRNDQALDALEHSASLARNREYLLRERTWLAAILGRRLPRGGKKIVDLRYAEAVVAGAGCLARGDALGAIEALDTERNWATNEIQGTAMLASAWLRVEPSGPAQDHRRRLGLVRFATLAFSYPRSGLGSVPVPGGGRSDAEIRALYEEVVALRP